MKTKECIQCETFFGCKGKPTRNPCLHFKKRKIEPDRSFESVFQNEIGRVNDNGSK